MSFCRRTSLFSLLVALIVCPVGCGPSTAKVSGTVSYEGKALVLGTVNLMGEDGRPHQGQIDADGKYSIVDPVPWGKYSVMIFSPDPLPPSSGTPRRKPTPEMEKLKREKEELRTRWVALPERYNDYEKSGLSVEVNKAVVDYDISLKQ